MTIWIILILAVLLVFVVGVYNGLIKLKNKCEEAWSDIDTQLKRRYDLIPNLVETVKGYAKHESSTFEKVTQARNMAMQAKSVQERGQAENMITGALKSLFALSENYPELKANQNFLNLQNTLKEIEEHIQLSRRYYNATVRDFNTKIQVFPNNIVAGIFSFKDREFFETDEESKENVKVSFKEESKPEAEPAAPEAPATPEVPAEPTEPKEESKPEDTKE